MARKAPSGYAAVCPNVVCPGHDVRRPLPERPTLAPVCLQCGSEMIVTAPPKERAKAA